MILAKIGVSNILTELGSSLEHPKDILHGDYMSSASLIYSKSIGLTPVEFAKKYISESEKYPELLEKNFVEK